MSNLLSVATGSSLIAKLNAELDTTVSSGNILVAQALISGGALNTPALIASGAILLNDENQTDANEPNQTDVNKNKAIRQQCKKIGKTYFRTLGNCYGDWKDLAITSPTSFGADLKIHGKKAMWEFTASGGSTNKMVNTGDYLEYNTGSSASLVGKTIRIDYHTS